MADQHDMVIADQAGSAFLADLNLALMALVKMNDGATEPPTNYAHELWADTANTLTKKRNAAGAAWVTFADGDWKHWLLDDGTVGAPAYSFNGDTDSGIYRIGANNIGVAVNGAKVLDIGTTGFTIVGGMIAPADLGSGQYGLQLTGNGVTHLRMTRTGSSTADWRNYVNSNTINWSDISGGGGGVMTFSAAGDFTISGSTATKASGTTWANPSDQRLKDGIADYDKGQDELMQVRARKWTYNGKGGTQQGLAGLGVVADEIMTVLPNTVSEYQARLNADDEDLTAIKKFDATEITWLLVTSLQQTITQLREVQAWQAAHQ